MIKDLMPWIGQFILVLVGSFLGSYLSYKVKNDRLKFDKKRYEDKQKKEAELDEWVKNTPSEPYRK